MTSYNPQIHHRRSIRLKGYDYSRAGLYFITICCQDRAFLFGNVVNGEMMLNDAGNVAMACWMEIPNHYPNVVLHEMVVMPNHVHGIVEFVGAKYISPEPTTERNYISPEPLPEINERNEINGGKYISPEPITERNYISPETLSEITERNEINGGKYISSETLPKPTDGNDINGGKYIASETLPEINERNEINGGKYISSETLPEPTDGNDINGGKYIASETLPEPSPEINERNEINGVNDILPKPTDRSEINGVNDVLPTNGVNDVLPTNGAKNVLPLRGTSQTVGAVVRGFKIGVTKWMRQNTNIHDVWQRNYHEHIIRDEHSYLRISEYIINNPAKWKEDKFFDKLNK